VTYGTSSPLPTYWVITPSPIYVGHVTVGSPEHLPIVRDGLRMILSVLGYSYFLKGSRIMRRTIPVGVPPAVSYTASNPIAVRVGQPYALVQESRVTRCILLPEFPIRYI